MYSVPFLVLSFLRRGVWMSDVEGGGGGGIREDVKTPSYRRFVLCSSIARSVILLCHGSELVSV